MTLSLADRIALIYSAEGSMRKTAAAVGLTHQQVSRILRRATELQGDARAKALTYYESQDYIVGGVDHAFKRHKEKVSAAAKRDGLPYFPDVPVFAERLPMKKLAVLGADGKAIFRGTLKQCDDFAAGKTVRIKHEAKDGTITYSRHTIKPSDKGRAKVVEVAGERVGALHLHWLSDELRNAWIAKSQKSGRYYAASVGSEVELDTYLDEAEERIKKYLKKGGIETESMIKAAEQLQNIQEHKKRLQRVYTPYTTMDPRHSTRLVLADINNKLQERHAPAVGAKGTALADQVLFQIDTRKSVSHAPATKPGKAKGTTTRRK